MSLGLTGPAAGADKNKNDDDHHHVIDEVIVSATPLERTVQELAQPTSVVDGDALTRKQAASIGETLAGELGVSATYFGPVASRPVIRGQFGERVRVLSNALDSLDASALSEDHAVSVDSILAERVEIVRGPATLLYGSGAAGGLVNIVDYRIAEQPLEKPFSGTAALRSDSALGLRSVAAGADFGTDRVALHLDGFRRTTDDIMIPGHAESAILRQMEEEEGEHAEEEAFGVVENTSSTVESGAAAVSMTGERSYFGVSVSGYDSEYGIPGHHHEEEGEEGGEEAAVRIALDQTRYDIKGEWNFDGFLNRAKLRLARNDYQHTEFEGTEVGTQFDTDGTDARIELRHRPANNFEGAFGIQYKNIDFLAEGDEAFVPASETTQLSLFLFEEYAISEDWALQGSFRAEHQNLDTPMLSGYDATAFGASLGSIWSLGKVYNLSANLALTERHPNATELFADGPHVAVQRYERGSLITESGVFDKEVSTNIDLTLRRISERVEWTVTAFVNRIDDYILLSPTDLTIDELPVFDYEQQDVEMYGIEAEALFDIFENRHGHLHTRVFADFVRGEESHSGEDLPRLPPLRWGIGIHFTRNAVDASIDVEFHSKQDHIASNELPTDAYSMLNAEVSYTFAGRLLGFVRGTNLTDEDARRHTSPLKDLIPLPGRSLHLGLRYDF